MRKKYILEGLFEETTGSTYTVVIEKGEDGYFISDVLELPGCHTQEKTIPELLKNTKEAIQLYLGPSRKKPKSSFLRVQKIEV
ncbi:MAG: hypothetical protein UX13_C0011G0020 [Candidatus Woesebacteria bacterium GW2011_GWB1_45_5]|uniref:HicB-like antitoxin of toxin-antitoxin system domain-containing protein n=1 Tax=Candidatus Woesebacteria bacterium GW2011_GWB1_45_5 TaxID=1618581 RepID=A0A0G1MQK9_9BACT|nr:MAG: hypothetical protein UX13_C0011G0020 [Candidatus Woesebacteria bacterium GW2011_GWB1_45_5]